MKQEITCEERDQTKCIHASREFNRTSAISPPIWQTNTFLAESSEHFAALAKAVKPAEFYSRYGNPTHQQVEAVMATLEGGEAALVTASGMGAICTSVMSLLHRGDHVVAQRNLYAGTATLLEDVLPRWGIECTFVDQTNAERWAEALRPNTKLIYAETPANPLMGLTDLQTVAALAKTRGITTIVDNTFATPINQRPLQYGIDVVDVRIRRLNLPEQNKQSVFARMRAERDRIARQYRAEGEEQALSIRASAERQREEILSEAYKQAEEIKGRGDAQAARVYGEAYSKNPDLYKLTRTLEAYRKALDDKTTVVLSSDSELLKLLTRGQ